MTRSWLILLLAVSLVGMGAAVAPVASADEHTFLAATGEHPIVEQREDGHTIISCPAAPGPSGSTYALPHESGFDTLRGAVAETRPEFLVGGALAANQINTADVLLQRTAATHFNVIASSNQMLWSAQQPRPDTHNFCAGDQFVGFAEAYDQTLRYHNLISGTLENQTPGWVRNPDTPWTKATLTAAMKNHITTTMDHYRGDVQVWDVVSEAIAGNGVPASNVFERVIGYPEYVELAFQFAAEAAEPDAVLLYDDAANYQGGRLEAIHDLVEGMLAKGIRVDAVGIELFGHDSPAWASVDDFKDGMARYASLGVQTAITQLSVRLTSQTPAAWQLEQQRQVYDMAMTACLDPASDCFMFMTWGVSDTYGAATALYAGLASDPGTATSRPYGGLLFDQLYRPRPAFHTVLELLQQPPPTAPGAPTLSATWAPRQVELSWTTPGDGGSPITGYHVYRGTSPGTGTLHASLPAATTSYTDTSATARETYYYSVSATNAVGEGAASNEVVAGPIPEQARQGPGSHQWNDLRALRGDAA